MIQLQFPEFLVLALPVAFACWRWGGFRPAWNWLFLVAVWAAAAIWLFHIPERIYVIPYSRSYLPGWCVHLWLLAPAFMWLRPWLRRAGITGGLRFAAIVLMLFALTGPEWDLGGKGIDIIVVADRSKSMPASAAASVRELIQNLENNRRSGDRVGLVTFGQVGLMEHDLSENAQTQEQFIQPVGPDGSNLNDGLLTALDLVNPDRPARILVLSDGESNGEPPTFAARRARELGVPIDFRLFEVVRTGDVAIRELSLPEEVGPLEPFQFTVGIHADRAAVGELTVLRDEVPFVSQTVDLLPGANRIAFRDVLAEGGLRNYQAVLKVEGDPLTDNNRGEGIVRVEAGPRLLVLNADGQPGNLVRALRAADLPVDVQMASEHPVTQDSLDGYRGIIIENVPASLFGRLKMERLAQFVQDLGGGLLLTGGQRSFGTGGYYQSPLDEVLPVSMEMREEHRKTRVAIAIALDRSGSMSMPVPGGKTKMDLANLGTAEVVKLLSQGDSVAVIAVDSSPHVVQPLTAIDDPASIVSKVTKIESMGGGIFVYEALVAAGNEVSKADQATKHIILFSDANDSEEPGAYQSLLSKYEAAGITVSVIGLGTKADVDAALLEDIAKRGQGNIMFTEDPQELPRLFTEDTMSVARSTFVEKDPATQPQGIEGKLIANAMLMGDLPALVKGNGFPNVDGYNLSYLKPDATVAVQSTDEYTAPWSAFWYRGLGRAAALTFEVDGKFSGQFGSWERYEDFLITHARWLMSMETPPDIYLDLTRVGQDAVLTVELDPQRPDRGSGVIPQVVVVPPGAERAEPILPEMTWVGPDTLEARFTLMSTGSYRTMVVKPRLTPDSRDLVLRGPAVTLPYSPEFDPRDTLPPGKDVLAEVSELSGGVQRTDVLEVLRDPPRSAKTMSMLPWLFGASILLLLTEIAGRRLSLWERLSELTEGALGDRVPEVTRAPAQGWWTKWRRERKTRRATGSTTSAGGKVSSPEAPPPVVKPTQDAPPATKPTQDIFAAAKDRAKKRLK